VRQPASAIKAAAAAVHVVLMLGLLR